MKMSFEKLLEEKSGVSKSNGKEWKMQSVLFTTTGEYPKKAAIEFWNELADSIKKVKPGTECDIEFNIEASEWKGIWYNKVKAWKFTALAKQEYRKSESAIATEDGSDQLPF